MDTPMVLRNRGGSLCYVEGYADLTVLDSAGKVIAQATGLAQRATFFGQPPEVPILLETETPALPTNQGPIPQELPLGQAEMHVEWYDCRSPVAARMTIDLPGGGGALTAEYAMKAPYSPVCDSPSGHPAAAFGRGPLVPTGVRWPPDPTYVPFAIDIAAPASVKRGTTLVYYVTLTNLSQTDYRLEPCPDYNQFLLRKKPVSMYQLNCGPVGRHIGVGAGVTFEMHETIPSDLEPGPNDLTWALMDGRVSPSVAHTAVVIT
jgi:hypothetical protein